MKNSTDPRCDISKASVLTCLYFDVGLKKKEKKKNSTQWTEHEHRFLWILTYLCAKQKEKKNLLSLVSLKLFPVVRFWKPQHWFCFLFFGLGYFCFCILLLKSHSAFFLFKSFFLALSRNGSWKDVSWRLTLLGGKILERGKKLLRRWKDGFYWTVFYLELEFCSLMVSLDFALWLQKVVGSNPCTGTALVLDSSAVRLDRISAAAVHRGLVVDQKVARSNPRTVRKPFVCWIDLGVECVWINV